MDHAIVAKRFKDELNFLWKSKERGPTKKKPNVLKGSISKITMNFFSKNDVQ
jgi:hypothetical protein